MKFVSAFAVSLLLVFSVTCQAWFFYWLASTAWNTPFYCFGLVASSWLVAFSVAVLVSKPNLPKLEPRRKKEPKPERKTEKQDLFEL